MARPPLRIGVAYDFRNPPDSGIANTDLYAQIMDQVAWLDGLGLDTAHVVASSFGGHLALRAAAHEPDRFRRMVQMGAPGLVPGQHMAPFMKALRFAPVRWLMSVMPPSRTGNRVVLRQIGHGATLDRDGNCVRIQVTAADLVALRAGVNTWSTLVGVAERVAGSG